MWVPDQRTATAFYVTGLGLTRDPYVMVGTENMWINVGAQQFHLPTNKPQVLRGVVGLVLQHFDALPAQLESVRDELAGTQFAWSVEDKHVAVTSPWATGCAATRRGRGATSRSAWSTSSSR